MRLGHRALVYSLVLATQVLVPPAAGAQNEPALRSFFEGKVVRLKIDMPGSADGVDVPAGAALDYKRYGDRLKRFGTAIRSGDTARVTLVKLKRDVIEFQLDGGGYGTIGDDTSTSANIPSVEKSNRERDLESRVKTESDAAKKRALQRELDDVRRDRERENRRIQAERAITEEAKARRIAQRRLEGGSRFNLRYAPVVPADIRPEHIMDALAEFVEFTGSDPAAMGPPSTGVRRGMLRADAERQLGAPVASTERREGALVVKVLTFRRGDEQITAEFVEDVLIRYTIAVR